MVTHLICALTGSHCSMTRERRKETPDVIFLFVWRVREIQAPKKISTLRKDSYKVEIDI